MNSHTSQAAAAGLDGIVHRTPLLRSETFSRLAGGDVLLKHENQQKTGAFKVRGAYTKIQIADRAPSGRPGVVAPSAGNHAQAVAWAARPAGVPAAVFMPEAASLAKVGATESYGATVQLVGVNVDESVEAAREYAERTGVRSCTRSTTRSVIAGQGTIGLEILEDAPDVDAVVVPLGGGGLLSGIAGAIKADAARDPGDRGRGGRLRAVRELARRTARSPRCRRPRRSPTASPSSARARSPSA